VSVRKRVVITQSNYIPWKGYFDALNGADECILLDDVQFTRRDWRNRNLIKTPQGPLWLTIPVEVRGKFSQRILDTRIAEPGWADKHWKTLRANYARAEGFAQYSPLFERLYAECAHEESLSRVNRRFIEAICETLGINTRLSWSTDYELISGQNEKLIHLCRQVSATDYYSGPAAKDYMDLSLWEAAGIRVHFLDYSGYPEYKQIHGPFTHGVSIVDLLLNVGGEARAYMKSFAEKDDHERRKPSERTE
jgi:hypothetical protein